MNALQRVGLGATSKYVKITDLEIGKEYFIDHFFMHISKYGPQLCVRLMTGEKTSLPKRFVDIVSTPKHLEYLNNANMKMIFRGVDNNRKDMVLVELLRV